MTTLDDLLFPVEKVKNPAKTNSEYAYIVRGEVDGKMMDLNYCSDRYELVPNNMIFPRIEAELESRGYKFSKAYNMIDNVRFYASYILEDQNLAIKSGSDQIKPMININHSYNGLTKYAITFGYFRMICSNGLTIPLEGQEEKNLQIVGKHTKEILNSFDQLWGKLDTFFTIQDNIKRKFEVLTDRKIENYADRLIEVLEATKVKPSKAQIVDIENTIAKEAKLLDMPVNDWLIYNGINAHIFKGVNSKGEKRIAAPEAKRTEDSKVLNYMLTNA